MRHICLHNVHKLEMYTRDSNENVLCLMPMKENLIILNAEKV